MLRKKQEWLCASNPKRGIFLEVRALDEFRKILATGWRRLQILCLFRKKGGSTASMFSVPRLSSTCSAPPVYGSAMSAALQNPTFAMQNPVADTLRCRCRKQGRWRIAFSGRMPSMLWIAIIKERSDTSPWMFIQHGRSGKVRPGTSQFFRSTVRGYGSKISPKTAWEIIRRIGRQAYGRKTTQFISPARFPPLACAIPDPGRRPARGRAIDPGARQSGDHETNLRA